VQVTAGLPGERNFKAMTPDSREPFARPATPHSPRSENQLIAPSEEESKWVRDSWSHREQSRWSVPFPTGSCSAGIRSAWCCH